MSVETYILQCVCVCVREREREREREISHLLFCFLNDLLLGIPGKSLSLDPLKQSVNMCVPKNFST